MWKIQYIPITISFLSQITTMMCGSCANENSFKMMYFKYMDDLRGGRDFTQEEMDSCMVNQAPGTPQVDTTILYLMTLQLFETRSLSVVGVELSWRLPWQDSRLTVMYPLKAHP